LIIRERIARSPESRIGDLASFADTLKVAFGWVDVKVVENALPQTISAF
jgi:hypothetical protein